MFLFYRDGNYQRLSQLIMDYENPLKKLVEDFGAHSRVCVFLNFISGQH